MSVVNRHWRAKDNKWPWSANQQINVAIARHQSKSVCSSPAVWAIYTKTQQILQVLVIAWPDFNAVLCTMNRQTLCSLQTEMKRSSAITIEAWDGSSFVSDKFLTSMANKDFDRALANESKPKTEQSSDINKNALLNPIYKNKQYASKLCFQLPIKYDFCDVITFHLETLRLNQCSRRIRNQSPNKSVIQQ